MQKNLKGQRHEISTLSFFHQSIVLGSLIIVLKYFQIWFRFRRDIREYAALRGVDLA
jgi:hypothetical protein